MIALRTYDQVYDNGRKTRILESIGRHRFDVRSVKTDDGFFNDSRGWKTKKSTTQEWHFLVKWRDGSKSCIPLRDVK